MWTPDRDRAEAVPAAFFDGGEQVFGLLPPGARQAQVHLTGADGRGGEGRPVQHQMGGEGQQRLVLPAGGFALHAVGDHYRGTAGRGHRAQFAAGGTPLRRAR